MDTSRRGFFGFLSGVTAAVVTRNTAARPLKKKVDSNFSPYEAIGLREDLSNVIYDVSPVETPFLSYFDRDNH